MCGANSHTLEIVIVTETQRKNQKKYTGLCSPLSLVYHLDHME